MIVCDSDRVLVVVFCNNSFSSYPNKPPASSSSESSPKSELSFGFDLGLEGPVFAAVGTTAEGAVLLTEEEELENRPSSSSSSSSSSAKSPTLFFFFSFSFGTTVGL